MAWPSANGPITLTLEHIADCVKADEDPLITPGRIKIGHTDPRFNEDLGDHDPFFDGEPAYGSIANLRLVNDGATAMGDYIYMPRWLAEGAPAFFPSRSIEGAYSVEDSGGKLEARWDVETPGGKKYSFVLTGCALLGVQAPAVKDLEDLQFRLTEGKGVIVTGDPEAGGVPLAVSMSGMSGPVSLEADVDKVIDTFYADFCTDERYWWWARAVRMDPNVIIADDDEGSLWEVAITTDGNQNVTFDDPKRVLQTFQPAPEAAAALSAAAQTAPKEGRTLKAFAARSQTAPEGRKEHPEGGVGAPGNNSDMKLSEDQIASLRKRLDLAEDADESQIAAALEAQPETPETPEAPEGPDAPDETPDEENPETPDENPDEDETPEDSPTVPVDKTALAELQANAELGRQAREKQVADHRETVLKAALKDGKITPASKKAWESKLKAAPEATEAELAALPDGLVPVEEIGHGGSSTDTAVELSGDDMELLFPGHGRKAA